VTTATLQRAAGPKGGYFSGSTAQFRRDQLGFYAACARDYGDVVATRMGPYRVLLIYHPDAIEELLVARNRGRIALTTSPDEVLANRAAGKLSAMIGIECRATPIL